MTWEFSTDPEFAKQLDWMREFVDDRVSLLETVELDDDEFRAAIAPLQEEVKQRGLWAAHLDPELGGQGFGQVKLGLMHEIIGRSRIAPYVFGNQAPDSGNSEILARFGTEEQRKTYLAPLLAGELRSAYVMTEPGAGADPTLLSTIAVRDGDDWVINGRKWFITNASVADFFIVMVVTDPDAPPRERASQLIVPIDTPGMVVERDFGTMEDPRPRPRRLDNHAEVSFTDVRVPASALLGDRGAGFAIAQSRLGPGRIHHCMRLIGAAQRALELMCQRANNRVVFGQPMIKHGSVREDIAKSYCEVEQARLLTLKAADTMDRYGNKEAKELIAMIKIAVPNMTLRVVDRAIQVHGAVGLSQDTPLAGFFAYARTLRLADGPDQVHMMQLGRNLAKRYE